MFKAKDFFLMIPVFIGFGGLVTLFIFFPFVALITLAVLAVASVGYRVRVKNSIPYKRFDTIYYVTMGVNFAAVFGLMMLLEYSRYLKFMVPVFGEEISNAFVTFCIMIALSLGLPYLSLTMLFKVKETYKEYQDEERRKARIHF